MSPQGHSRDVNADLSYHPVVLRILMTPILLFCPKSHSFLSFFFLKILFIFDRERECTSRGRSRQREREKQALRRAGSPMRGSIPGLWDHDPSRRQTLNHLSHPGAPILPFFNHSVDNRPNKLSQMILLKQSRI